MPTPTPYTIWLQKWLSEAKANAMRSKALGAYSDVVRWEKEIANIQERLEEVSEEEAP